jgi:putative membrane protein insertion efficiency factor
MRKIIQKSIIIFLRIYKVTVSNFFYAVLGGGCKYQKSCSEFAIDAINEKGILKGIKVSLKRFLSCQPFSDKYYDNLSDIK